jgi:DNA-binding NarL/FixJ family response regulator
VLPLDDDVVRNISHAHTDDVPFFNPSRGLILRMIREGRTNLAIGEMLKHSESTIRQETIKIFSKLGCDGRVEASHIYKIQESKSLHLQLAQHLNVR